MFSRDPESFTELVARAASLSSSLVSFHFRCGIWWWMKLRVELGFLGSPDLGNPSGFVAPDLGNSGSLYLFEMPPSSSPSVGARGFCWWHGDVRLFFDFPVASRRVGFPWCA